MSRIDELIAFNVRRLEFYNEEISRIEQLPEGKHTTHKDHDRWLKDFNSDRRDVRDTISYLKAFKNHGVQA